MSEPFLGEIRLMSFNHNPKRWALCNGQTLPISTNQALFSLLGTTYGGNGQTTFALPDLRGRVPVGWGSGFELGQTGGEAAHAVTMSEMPTHVHQLLGTSERATTAAPGGNVLAGAKAGYRPVEGVTSLRPDTVANSGGSQLHENRQPFLTMSFCIAMTGIFPSRT
ncbi:phage tail protein [Nocardioides sp. Bht2]|uniref:phage tail protein n=1 Tax=Nocardioides sp. Bht2 TaxID=3392297 RepID=UPI0039B3E2F5